MRAVINVVIPVPGLSSIPDGTAPLISEAGLSGVITDDLARHCVHVDRQAALVSMLAHGGLADDDKEDRFQVAIGEARQQRKQRSISKVAFVFEAELDVPAVVPSYKQDFENFSVFVGGIGTDLVEKLRTKVNRGIEQAVSSAFVVLGSAKIETITEVGSAVFTITENDWITYNLNISVGPARLIVTEAADATLIERLGRQMDAYRQKKLSTVCQLLTEALDDQNHELHRYISAWTALLISP